MGLSWEYSFSDREQEKVSYLNLCNFTVASEKKTNGDDDAESEAKSLRDEMR